MNQARSLLLTGLIALCVATFSACVSGPFSGSGAMRIEVEVYKGPLSQEPEIQWGELAGYLEEAKRSLVENLNFTLSVVANKDFKSIIKKQAVSVDIGTNKSLVGAQAVKDHVPHMYLYLPVTKGSKEFTRNSQASIDDMDLFRPLWCDSLDPEGLLDQLDYLDCIVLRAIYVDSLDLIREITRLLHDHDGIFIKPASEPAAEETLRQVAAFSSNLRAKAFRWAVAGTGGQSFNPPVRIAVFTFAVSASEFGNQLQARADALMKQFNGPGHDRRELPLSTHLREIEPTDFMHLYDWLGGSIDSFRYNLPEFLFTGRWPTSVRDKVKIVDRLFADHFWSRINTVYASGKGEISMAFVKDELGNWNLKNFDNAPGELLDSYMQLGTTLVKKAGELALAVNSGGGTEAVNSIQELLKEAHDVQNSIQATPNAASEARSRLKALDEQTALILNVLTTESEKQDHATLEDLKKDDIPDKNALENKLISNRQKTITEIKKVLTGYKQQVDLIEKVSIATALKQVKATPNIDK
jgi:hypothetical protein